MLTLVSDVATAYFQLIELDRELEIARESAETYTDTLELFTRRYLGGTDTKLSTSRAEAALDSSSSRDTPGAVQCPRHFVWFLGLAAMEGRHAPKSPLVPRSPQ